jgi:hypothetical protein
VDIEGEHSLLNILNNHNVPKDLDFISIDVDGADYHLWDVIGAQYQARLVCIEFNPTIPNHVHYVQPRDIAVQEGSSLLALVELGRSFGYHIVVTTTFNAIFVRQDLLPLLPEGIFTYLPAPGSQASSWTPTTSTGPATINRVVDLNSLNNGGMSTDIFQTYSGELKLCGPKKLFWHRVPMNIQQMQAIKAKKDRVFPFAPPYQETISGLDSYLACITPLLAGLMTAGKDAAVGAASSTGRELSANKVKELSSSLHILLTSCREIFGLGTRELKKNRGNPLQSIAHEVLMNVLAMSLIAHHQLCISAQSGDSNRITDASAPSADSMTAQELSRFLGAVAEVFEQLADRVLDAHASLAPASRASQLEEARRWLERAVYVVSHLRAHASASAQDAVEGPTRSLRRLSCKLSSCCLLEGAQTLPWAPLLKAQHAAQDASSTHCASTEELDCLLRGQFWLQCITQPSPEVASLSACSTLSAEDTTMCSAVAKRWQSKMRWADGTLPGHGFTFPAANTDISGAHESAGSPSLNVAESQGGEDGAASAHGDEAYLRRRNLELEERLKRSAQASAWASGLSFIAGGCAVAMLGYLAARVRK